MQASKLIAVVALLMALSFLGGCSADSGQADAGFGTHVGRKPAPLRGRRDEAVRSNAPANTTQMFAQLEGSDRKLVESFYGNYGEMVLEFDNSKEFDWIARHGYPMPDDVVTASRFSDDELRRKFEDGDPKAGYFLLDRMARRSNGHGTLDELQLADRVLATDGPFSGYAYFRYYSQIEGEWERALSGLLWADLQGDWRAKSYFDNLVQTGGRFHQKLAPGDVAGAFEVLLSQVRFANPALLTRPIDPRIKYWGGRH